MKPSKNSDQPLPHQRKTPTNQTEQKSAAQDPRLEILPQDQRLQPRLLRIRQHLPLPLRHRNLSPQNLLQQQATHSRVAETHPGMRPHQRERFADQHQTTVEECCARGGTVADGRDEGFGGLGDEFQEGGFEDVSGVGFLLGPHFGAHFADGERVAVSVAGGVGHVLLEGRRAGGAVGVPDPV